MEFSATYNASMIGILLVLAAIYIWDCRYAAKNKAGLPSSKKSAFAAFFERRYAVEAAIFCAVFLIFFLLNNHEFVAYNNYSYLADALLHGKISVPDMPEYLESVEFGGEKYMHFAPGPALLCLPFVAILGVSGFNSAYLCMALGAANAVLYYKVFERLEIGATRRDRLWFTAFAVLGTVHFFLATIGHSWFLGHVATLFFLLLAMYFIMSKNEAHQLSLAFVAGLFFGLAVTCRISNIIGGLFFLGYICIYKKSKIKTLLLFAAGAAIPGALYMLYNYARFGTIMDLGYNLTHLKDKHRALYDTMQALPKEEQLAYLRAQEAEVGGPLQAKYIGYNLYSIFLMMPEFSAEYPYIVPTMAGVSITFLSPVLYFFVAADWKKKLPYVLAATMVLSAIPFLLNYGNGMAQFGMRYAMDFLPYMIILACMGMRSVGRIKSLLICYCILANAWGPVFWNCFYLS